MEIEQSSLYSVVQDVQGSPTNAHFTWTAYVHAGGQDLEPLKVLHVDQDMDFFSKFADETMLTLVMHPSEFLRYVYPNQEAIEITLIKTPMGEIGTESTSNQNFQSERYVATYIDKGNPVVQNTTNFNSTSDNMDYGDVIEIEFQLINVAIAKMRLLPTGGIYRQMVPADVLRSVLTKYSAQVRVDDLRKPQGVNMVKANNLVPREQIVIPHGTALVDVPKLIQQKYGVYSSGFSYYYYQDRWWVWPCYDTERNTAQGGKGVIIGISANKMPEAERTFMVGGGCLTILATGDKKFKDDSNTLRANQGNGTRFTNADTLMSAPQVSNNRAYISRGANNTEVISTRNDSGFDNVLMSPAKITSNPYMEYSRLAGREGSAMAFVWENSDPSLLYPGMPFTYYYIDGDDIKELQGILMKATSATRLNGIGYTETRYKTSTVITLYVRRTLQ